jgi:hypothetical protein
MEQGLRTAAPVLSASKIAPRRAPSQASRRGIFYSLLVSI